MPSLRRTFGGSSLIMALVAGAGLHPAMANLIINGSFELPAAPDSLVSITPSGEPLGFGWTVNKGDVEVFDGAGTRGIGAAYDGSQLLDLNGSSIGGISQVFVTNPGAAYQLTFAYANNWVHSTALDPATANVRVFDTGSSLDVMTPLAISHGTSTGSNLGWTIATLTFTPTGTSTTLNFDSTRYTTPYGGIFLDSVSVTAVPEPEAMAAATAASLTGLALLWRRRQ